MKKLIFLLFLVPLFVGCEDDINAPESILGNWESVKTDHYQNNVLTSSRILSIDELFTFNFSSDGKLTYSDNTGRLENHTYKVSGNVIKVTNKSGITGSHTYEFRGDTLRWSTRVGDSAFNVISFVKN